MLFKIKNLEYKKSNKTILNNLNFNIGEGEHLDGPQGVRRSR